MRYSESPLCPKNEEKTEQTENLYLSWTHEKGEDTGQNTPTKNEESGNIGNHTLQIRGSQERWLQEPPLW